jgi:hypothetical protein
LRPAKHLNTFRGHQAKVGWSAGPHLDLDSVGDLFRPPDHQHRMHKNGPFNPRGQRQTVAFSDVDDCVSLGHGSKPKPRPSKARPPSFLNPVHVPWMTISLTAIGLTLQAKRHPHGSLSRQEDFSNSIVQALKEKRNPPSSAILLTPSETYHAASNLPLYTTSKSTS